jgi:hypothetical protein
MLGWLLKVLRCVFVREILINSFYYYYFFDQVLSTKGFFRTWDLPVSVSPVISTTTELETGQASETGRGSCLIKLFCH